MSALTSRRTLLVGVAALPALSAPLTAKEPSDLARACDASIALRKSLDAQCEAGRWDTDDDGFSDEVDKVCEGKDRAVAEPSWDLGDLAAKARLALDDFWMFNPDPEHHDLGDQLRLAVLQDVVRLCA